MIAKASDVAADSQPETGIYTETLARLYLQQGFFERALSIYRHLAQEQPENCQWQAQLITLEQQLQQSSLGLAAVVEGPLPQVDALRPPQTMPCPTYAVIAQLERWLSYLQRQSTPR